MLTRLVTRLSDSHPWVSGYNKLFFSTTPTLSLFSPLGDYTSIIEGRKRSRDSSSSQIYDLLSSFMRSLWIGTHALYRVFQELSVNFFSAEDVRRDIKLQGLTRIVQKKILLIFYLMFCLSDWSTRKSPLDVVDVIFFWCPLDRKHFRVVSLEIHIMFTNWAFSSIFSHLITVNVG